MASLSSPARRPAVRTRVAYLGAFFGAGLGLSALYATTGLGVGCAFRAVTGWECPLCGGTRMGSALLHGDLVAAFAFNPVALIGLTGLGVAGAFWLLEALGGPAVRLPAALSTRLRRVRPNQWLVAGLVFSTVYVVLRNLL